jgi:hypothetical protein
MNITQIKVKLSNTAHRATQIINYIEYNTNKSKAIKHSTQSYTNDKGHITHNECDTNKSITGREGL